MMTVYSVYYDTYVLTLPIMILQIVSCSVKFAVAFEWFRQLMIQQGGGWLDVNVMTTAEFSFIAFWIPHIIYAPMPLIWNLFTGDYYWQNHTAANIMFQINLQIVFSIAQIGKCFNSFVRLLLLFLHQKILF